MNEVYIVMTEMNGYKNIEPHPAAYAAKEDAEFVKTAHEQEGRYDQVYVLGLPILGDGYPILQTT